MIQTTTNVAKISNPQWTKVTRKMVSLASRHTARTPETMDTSFKTKFRILAREKQKSLLQISKETGLAYSAIHKWYTGATRPTAENLNKLAKALECDPSLLGDDTKPLPQTSQELSLGQRLCLVIDDWGHLDTNVALWANRGKEAANERGKVSDATVQAWRDGRKDPTPAELSGVCEVLRLRPDAFTSNDGPGKGRAVYAGIPTRKQDINKEYMARCFARAMLEREYVTNPELINLLEAIATSPEQRFRNAKHRAEALEINLRKLLKKHQASPELIQAAAEHVAQEASHAEDWSDRKTMVESIMKFAEKLHQEVKTEFAEEFLKATIAKLDITKPAHVGILNSLTSPTETNLIFAPRIAPLLSKRLEQINSVSRKP